MVPGGGGLRSDALDSLFSAVKRGEDEALLLAIAAFSLGMKPRSKRAQE